jgi:hypothetical protein
MEKELIRGGNDKVTVPDYKRSDFLRFDAVTRGDNKDITQSESDDTDELENYADFGNWKDYETLEAGKALKLMTWCIFHFGPHAVDKSKLPQSRIWAEDKMQKWLSCDDVAFVLLVLEHSINKWIRLCKYEELTRRKKSRKEAELTKGSKFPSGSGISSKEGQARFVGLKTYIQKSYYDETEQANKNLQALNKSIKDLVAKIEGDQMAKTAEAVQEHTQNPEIEAINDASWLKLFGVAYEPV